MHYVFLNGEFVPAAAAALNVKDLAIQRGYAVFDFFRLLNNTPLFIDDHLDRLFFSASEMHLRIPYSKTELIKILSELINRNNLPDSGIRITVTGGNSADGMSIAAPGIIITQQPIQLPTAKQKEAGIKLISHNYHRQLSHVKSIDYLMAIWLKPLLQQTGTDEILYHQNGRVTECPRSNVFMIASDETIVTPATGILPGITRKKVLELAANHFAVEEKDFTLSDLKSAKEVFITSTTKEILPVRQLDEVEFNGNKVTSQLQQMFAELVNVNSPNQR